MEVAGADKPLCFKAKVYIKGVEDPYLAIVDTGATLSVVSSSIVPAEMIKSGKTVGIQVGDGKVIWSLGMVELTLPLGHYDLSLNCAVIETTAFDCVIGTDLFKQHPKVLNISTQEPYGFNVLDENGNVTLTPFASLDTKAAPAVRLLHKLPEDLSIPLKEYVNLNLFLTESYKLSEPIREQAMIQLGINPENVQVELFASTLNSSYRHYCSKSDSAFKYCWNYLGLCYANPPFSMMSRVLTKIVMDQALVVLVTPDWMPTGQVKYWKNLLDAITVRQVSLPQVPLYVRDGGHEPLPAPSWSSSLSLCDGRKANMSQLDPVLVKWLAKVCQGHGPENLKSRSACPVANSSVMLDGGGGENLEGAVISTEVEEDDLECSTNLVEHRNLEPPASSSSNISTPHVSEISRIEELLAMQKQANVSVMTSGGLDTLRGEGSCTISMGKYDPVESQKQKKIRSSSHIPELWEQFW